ncbi:ribosome silencing factor [Lyticum sinuosum]|uniref:Ribosomal silencing factor RsfS n=1 Tax=Lyticum sinuosum TaxID=1332059 RepID=A0AAE4VL54_9RICK|nr:ribosome silencing factor [Lyticum sinuosum]MDZ5761498.1 Ribosomal silencing factor RsfS [Lyticum sinuosum]
MEKKIFEYENSNNIDQNQQNNKEFCYNIVNDICTKLDMEKAEEIISYEFNDNTSIAYYGIVASGISPRHVIALSNKIVDDINTKYLISAETSGQSKGNWVVIYFGEIIVHIFEPRYREAYNIEKMWYDLKFIERKIGDYPKYFEKDKKEFIDPVDLLIRDGCFI